MANSRWRLLRSKEAIAIIIWYAVISLWLQGNGFAPLFMLFQSQSQPGQWAYAICIIVSYPIIGLLADMWIGRYKLINFSLWIKWITVVVVTLMSSIVIVFHVTNLESDLLVTILTVLEQIGFSAFQVTAIQFGTDQLQGVPERFLSSFIFWYFWVEQLATPIVEWVNLALYYCSINNAIWILLGWSIMVAFFLSIILSTKSCFMFNWFVREPGSPNPYRLLYHVMKFAFKHKHPVQRSALTNWEDKKPSRIDYGKCKYGGPFTTEEVENVKKLLKLSAVLFSLLGIFVCAFTIQLHWQTLVMVHFGNRTHSDKRALLFEAACDTVVLGALIPIHELLIYPFLKKYIPSMLKRIWIGAALTVACALSILLIDAIGHALSSSESVCFLLNPQFPLNISRYLVIIPSVLYGLHVITFNIALVELIIIRSPHSMKGMLLGLFYTLRYGITECFPLSLNYAFGYPYSPHHLSCGSAFYLMITLVALVSLLIYTLVACKLKNWKHNEAIEVDPLVEDNVIE